MQNLDINLKGVHILLKGLKTFKATGPDSIPTRPTDGRLQNEVQVRPDKLEMGAYFCYLGNMLSADGGCELVVTIVVKTALGYLLSVLSSHHL